MRGSFKTYRYDFGIESLHMKQQRSVFNRYLAQTEGKKYDYLLLHGPTTKVLPQL
jgi:hypothetical protein